MSLLVFAYGQRSGTAARQRDTCEQVNELKAAITNFIAAADKRSIKALPENSYYRAHPVELGKAIAQINQQEVEAQQAFAQSNC